MYIQRLTLSEKSIHCHRKKKYLHVDEANYITDYQLKLKFNNDEIRTVDFKNELYGEVFEPLKDKQLFKDFFISHNTVEWKNGADFAPKFLFEIGQKV
ncbi:MAG: DUF2442 domain-containing protein [Campylobacterota bacterium]|nr:DUF2442 domain-containing protein [Campylobacterota bacterium]